MIRFLAPYFGNFKQLFAKNGNGKLLFHHRDTEFTEDYKFNLCCIPAFLSFAVAVYVEIKRLMRRGKVGKEAKKNNNIWTTKALIGSCSSSPLSTLLWPFFATKQLVVALLCASVVKCSCWSFIVLEKAVHSERVRTAFAFLDVSIYPQKRARNQ